MLAIYVLLLALTSQCFANEPLENMELYVSYFPYDSIMDTNPEHICKEIYVDKNDYNLTYFKCALNNTVEFDETIFLFTPRKNATVANPVFLDIYTANPLNKSVSLRDDYHFDTGFYEVRIDKIGSDYMVRQFLTLPYKDVCQLSVILGFQHG